MAHIIAMGPYIDVNVATLWSDLRSLCGFIHRLSVRILRETQSQRLEGQHKLLLPLNTVSVLHTGFDGEDWGFNQQKYRDRMGNRTVYTSH